MNLKALYLSLSDADRATFSRIAGTTPGYMHSHVIHGQKIPKRGLMEGLYRACRRFGQPRLVYADLLGFFYPQPKKRAA